MDSDLVLLETHQHCIIVKFVQILFIANNAILHLIYTVTLVDVIHLVPLTQALIYNYIFYFFKKYKNIEAPTKCQNNSTRRCYATTGVVAQCLYCDNFAYCLECTHPYYL